MKETWIPIILIIGLFLFNITIGLLDVGSNLISTIPFLAAAKATAEATLEIIQTIVNLLGSIVILMKASQ
jgi:hypothetical protein